MAARAGVTARRVGGAVAAVRPDPERLALAARAAERRVSWSDLSAAIRRNPAYIQQYLVRGSPRRLAEGDRRVLAAVLGADERELGGPEPAPAPPCRCRLCRAPDRAAAAEAFAAALYESRTEDGEARAWADAGDYWRDVFRGFAAGAAAWLHPAD